MDREEKKFWISLVFILAMTLLLGFAPLFFK